MNPEEGFMLLALGVATLICMLGFFLTFAIVLIIGVFRCCCYCFRVTPSVSTLFLEGRFLNNFDSFKSKHVVSPEERPYDEDGWFDLMCIRGLFYRRKHTFIVEPSHVVEHQFRHYSGDIYISDRKLNVVYIERHMIIYDGRAFVKVKVDISTRPVHFVDFDWTVYKQRWLLRNSICVIMGFLQNIRISVKKKYCHLRIKFN